MATKPIPDERPRDQGTQNLQNKNTDMDLGTGRIQQGASYSNARRRTGRVAGISMAPNPQGEDRKQMPGLDRT